MFKKKGFYLVIKRDTTTEYTIHEDNQQKFGLTKLKSLPVTFIEEKKLMKYLYDIKVLPGTLRMKLNENVALFCMLVSATSYLVLLNVYLPTKKKTLIKIRNK